MFQKNLLCFMSLGQQHQFFREGDEPHMQRGGRKSTGSSTPPKGIPEKMAMNNFNLLLGPSSGFYLSCIVVFI